jgi:hypothetical protein
VIYILVLEWRCPAGEDNHRELQNLMDQKFLKYAINLGLNHHQRSYWIDIMPEKR